jgi:hypothetical protein
MYMHLTGVIGWLVVALAWHDRSLIMLNGVAAFIFINGIIASLFQLSEELTLSTMNGMHF